MEGFTLCSFLEALIVREKEMYWLDIPKFLKTCPYAFYACNLLPVWSDHAFL